ncbi:MAG: hypothetical protein WC006_04875 [Bacilli bacterium]|nr:hypothetical protein [Bacilli bacterium]
MINVNDYKSYIHANYNFIELLRENNSLVYDRLSDLLKVLGFIELLYDQKKPIEEELELIFDVGFSFFHEQFEEIKLYYNNYFKRNFLKFMENELLINYTLYLDDLEEVLKEKKIYDNEIDNSFKEIKQEIDDILRSKKNISIDTLNRYNEIIELLVPVGTLTTLEIYAMIVEELQI